MKTPEQIAADIIGRFAWHTNVVGPGGCLIGQQHAVAEAIADAIRTERLTIRVARNALFGTTSALAGVTSGRLKPKGKIAAQAFAEANNALGLTRC